MDTRTLASINLHAILRSCVPLVNNDPVARNIVKDSDISVRFDAAGITPLTLIFDHGTARSETSNSSKADLRLGLVSPEHVNTMIAGKSIPVPIWGARHMSFLTGPFTELTDRLSYIFQTPPNRVLTAEEENLKTLLTAYIVFASLCEVANTDPIGQELANTLHDGGLTIEIPSADMTYACQIKDHHLTFSPDDSPLDPLSQITFDSKETFQSVLDGSADVYALIGLGKIAIRGYVPNINVVSKMLRRVSHYLVP